MSKRTIVIVFASVLTLVLLTPVAWYFGLFHVDWPYILGFSDAPAAPVTKPIDISKKGNKVDFLVRIEDNMPKVFVDLYYNRYRQTKIDDKTYDKLVEKYLCTDHFERKFPHFPIKITVKAVKDTNITLIDDVVNPSEPVEFANSRTMFYKKLEPGIYEIIVETVNDYPELKDLDVWIHVNYDFAK